MQLSEIRQGEIFTIGETPSYPKLRTETGYIDMRDCIVKTCDILYWDMRVMDKEEVSEQFDMPIDEVDKWIAKLI